MNKKLDKVRENIRITEGKIRELQEHLRTLKTKERQLCDEEILKTIKEMAGKNDVMKMLESLGKGLMPCELSNIPKEEEKNEV